MQLWFAHGGKVSIREQLVTQVVLGILSNDLLSGQRLPSTRELARRFHLHSNTVSAGYRQLERERCLSGHLKTGQWRPGQNRPTRVTGTELFYSAESFGGKFVFVRQLRGPHLSTCP